MKRYHVIGAICFVPFFVGIALFMIGAMMPSFTVVDIGKIMMIAGMPVGCIAYGISYVIYINRRKKRAGYNEPTRENVPVSEDPLPGERRISEGEYETVADVVTPHDPDLPPTLRGKVLWGIWTVLMLAGFAFLFVSIMLEDMRLIIVSASVFFAAVLATAVGKLISERVSLGFDKDKSHYSEITDGVVRSCTMSSAVQIGFRPAKVVYRVVVSVGDRDYVTHSRKQYAVGESVTVAIRSRNRVSIVE